MLFFRSVVTAFAAIALLHTSIAASPAEAPPPANQASADYYEKSAGNPSLYGFYLDEWIRADKFKALEEKLDLLERERSKDVYGRNALDLAFEQQLRAWDLGPHLEEYCARFPDSYWARLLMAKWLSDSAWAMKDGTWTSMLTPAEMQVARNKRMRCGEMLEEALELRQDEVHAYTALLTHIKVIGFRDERLVMEIYREADSLRHDSYWVGMQRMAWLSPYWGGSEQAFLAFANECADPALPDARRLLYINAHQTLLHDNPRATSGKEFWEKASAIYERALQQGENRELLNEYLHLAMKHDRAKAAELVKRIGFRWDFEQWSYLRRYIAETSVYMFPPVPVPVSGNRPAIYAVKPDGDWYFLKTAESFIASHPGVQKIGSMQDFTLLPDEQQIELADAMLDIELLFAFSTGPMTKELQQWLRQKAADSGYPYLERPGMAALQYRPDDWALVHKALENFQQHYCTEQVKLLLSFLSRHPKNIDALRWTAENMDVLYGADSDKRDELLGYSADYLEINPTPTAALFRCEALLNDKRATETVQTAERFLRVPAAQLRKMTKQEYTPYANSRGLTLQFKLLNARARAYTLLGQTEEAENDRAAVRRVGVIK